VAIYRCTASWIDQRGGLCLHSLHGSIFGVKAMFGAYVRLKWNYVALRKSLDNQQQQLFLGQRWIIRNMMWMWLSSFITKEDTGIVQ